MSEAPLMVTISGVRGIAGESLVKPVVWRFVMAFGKLLKEVDKFPEGSVIVLGRDSRVSGPEITEWVVHALRVQGFVVENYNIVPTPTVQFMVQRRKAAAGIIITSSHNPKPWNGLKFVESDGLFLSPEKCQKMFAFADEFKAEGDPKLDGAVLKGERLEFDNMVAIDRHVDEILALPYMDVEAVKANKFKVVLDTVCGAGFPAMNAVLTRLGCEVIGLNTETSGEFPRLPEPIPEHLGELCAAVVEHKADMGVAVDPDVDRCVLIGEDGKPLVEEYTLATAVHFFLHYVGRRGPVCKNLSSSLVIDDIAQQHGCECIHAAVGEINVAKKMVEVNAVIGGEGNGGVMLPDIHIGRDAPVAIALVLQCFTEVRKEKPGITISEFKKSLPQYEIVKLKAPITGLDVDRSIEAIKKEVEATEGLTFNTIDGLYIRGSNWWVHLRKSNTEPIIRVIGEAPTAAQAVERCEQYMKKMQAFKL